ncbi:MAG: RluA family pseudouridine synthase [Duncaniella sp.]|nr:RluA family pseudouridine synthase [Duncaniella sp.]
MPRRNDSDRGQAYRPDVIKTFRADSEGRLIDFLIASMPEQSRTAIKQKLAHNQVMVNGAVTTQFDTPVHPGSVVKVNFTREFRTFYNRRLKILYEDDDIIVVNKGYGLLSMGTDKIKDGTAYELLREWVKWQNPANKLFIIHRLDRDTSGLMMFAKTEEAKEAMQYNWKNMVRERKYVALVDGRPDPEEGSYRSYLAENSRYEVYSTKNPEEGKLAVTRYRTLASGHGYSLVELSLDTGRKNQIRVHMKDLGCPISGDRRYGGKPSPAHRMCLHAQTLKFIHPVTRKLMEFTTPVPISFEKAMK